MSSNDIFKQDYRTFLYFFFLTALHCIWDLSCPTRDQTCAPFSEAWILTTGPLETPWISSSDSISDTAAQASAASTPHMNRNSSCSPRHTSPAVPDIHVSAQNCPPWPPSPTPGNCSLFHPPQPPRCWGS